MSRFKIGIITLGATMGILTATSAGAWERGPVDLHRGSFMEAAQTAKQSQCIKTCRSRYRDCQSQKQVPSFDCRDVYKDCIHFTCNVQG